MTATLRFLRAAILAASATLNFCTTFVAAESAAPVSPATAKPTDPTAPVELSPFEVRAENDVGYQAANTTSGSRLNTRLKDTPAAISPFTPEFLSDLGATSLADMIGYATNIEIDTEDATNGWTYDAATNSVNFEEGYVPVEGDHVQIDYSAIATCD